MIQNFDEHDPIYITDIGEDLPIFEIFKPYVIILVIAICVFIGLYFYMSFTENNQTESSKQDVGEESDEDEKMVNNGSA